MKTAQAGTLESNDIMITITPRPSGSGVDIDLESIVLPQYGEAIRKVLADVLETEQVTDVYIKAVDRGALDCTIQARLMAALLRAGVISKAGEA